MKIVHSFFSMVLALLIAASAFAGDQVMLSDYQSLVSKLARDDAGKLTDDDRDQAIELAVQRYNADRPRSLVEDVSAPGGHYLDLPVNWDGDFSTVQSIEHPVGNVPPEYVNGSWLYYTPTATQIGMPDSLSTGETVRVTFTAPHLVDSVNDTIPLRDREAVASYASAILCDQLATLYSGDSDSTIQADAVNHQSKASEFASRARSLRTRYFDQLGVDPKKTIAASAMVDMDMTDSRGRGRFYHR